MPEQQRAAERIAGALLDVPGYLDRGQVLKLQGASRRLLPVVPDQLPPQKLTLAPANARRTPAQLFGPVVGFAFGPRPLRFKLQIVRATCAGRAACGPSCDRGGRAC